MDYKLKYLKYKQKYLALKQGGKIAFCQALYSKQQWALFLS
jgi:hypothetical protein